MAKVIKYMTQNFEQNRNLKMIQVLESQDIVGTFLFFLYGKIDKQLPGFIFPVGMDKDLAEEFSDEFLQLFGRYTQTALNRRKRNG